MAKAPKYKVTTLTLKSGPIKVYASPKIGDSLREVLEDMNLYKGVRLLQVLETVYVQGKKDGARAAFDVADEALVRARKAIPHRNPGKPKKRK